jgi:hypothetical protein
MLYEIFFDSDGQHRAEPKLERFNDVFKLQANPALAGSFAFIQGCLAPFADRYFEIPGSTHEVTLTVRTVPSKVGDVYAITAIWRDSTNILHHEPDTQGLGDWFAKRDQAFTYPELRDYLSESTVVPLQQLRVDLDFAYTKGMKISWPADLELQRPAAMVPLS